MTKTFMGISRDGHIRICWREGCAWTHGSVKTYDRRSCRHEEGSAFAGSYIYADPSDSLRKERGHARLRTGWALSSSMIGGHGARNAAGPASKADVGSDTIGAEATTALERFRQRSRSYRGIGCATKAGARGEDREMEISASLCY